MRQGFVKTGVCTPEVRVADCVFNAYNAAALIKNADSEGSAVVVFPELGLTGYTCGDLFLQQTLLDGASDALLWLCDETRETETVAVVGLPLPNRGKLYNCAAVIQKGKILGIVPKTAVPNYNEFYELRHFSPAPKDNATIKIGGCDYPFGTKLLFSCDELPELVLAVEICEDLWQPAPPSVSHAIAGATIIANLSASDEVVGKSNYRRVLVTGQSSRLICGYLYCDAGEGESTTDMVYSGHNLIAENGVILDESTLFKNKLTLSEIDVYRLMFERRRITTYPACEDDGYMKIGFSLPLRETTLTRKIDSRPFIPEDNSDRAARCEEILAIQANGLKKRLAHSGAKTAVVGISGGLDSCLALLVSVSASDLLGRSRQSVVAVTMPCFGTTSRTKHNAMKLSELLGVTLREIDITEAVKLHFKDIGHDISNKNVVFENSQARERTQVLMDIANQTNGLVVGTGDLSELALGWATYNGDHMSMYGVNASVPKTLIRHIVRYAADTGDAGLKAVLYDILDTPVSPELLPAEDGKIAQKTEDLVGPYDLHDFFIYNMVRWGFTPAKMFRLAVYAFTGEYDGTTILKWLKVFYRRFFSQQFKRSCLPDGPKVGSVTLSPRGDWRMPSDACASLWLDEIEELK